MPRLYLAAAEIAAVRDGRKTEHRAPVLASNSTVNGRRPNRKHSATEWFDGWLDLDWSRAWVDGFAAAKPVEMPADYALFGLGRNDGYSCGEYFHVGVAEPHGGAYRVRSRVEPGDVVNLPEKWRYVDFEIYGDRGSCAIEYGDGSRAWGRRHGSTEDLVDVRLWWQSALVMPAWAVRTRARILEVRAEWLHDINREKWGGMAEGAYENPSRDPGFPLWRMAHGGTYYNTPQEAYAAHWDASHGHKPGLSWASNPPVWVWRLEVVR